MLQRIKKTFAILIIIVLLPYIITIFMNGGNVESTEKTDGTDELLKAYCIGTLAKEVSSDYEDEMLKAQALLVRTTVYKQIEELGEAIFEQEDFGDISEIDGTWYRKLEQIWDDTERVRAEIERIIPIMKEGGGYVFGSDHSIPSSVSLENMKMICELAHKLGTY
jgi:stage II sporulation protein D